MGWDYTYIGHGETNKADLIKYELEKYGDIKVLDFSLVGNVYYAACIETKKPDEIWGLVALLSLEGDGYFGYKIMDETVGPCYYDCPDRILKLLTPTNNDWANNWRNHCIKQNAKHRYKAPRF